MPAMSIVTPEKWYIVFWIGMGLGYVCLNAVATFIAVVLALRYTGR